MIIESESRREKFTALLEFTAGEGYVFIVNYSLIYSKILQCSENIYIGNRTDFTHPHSFSIHHRMLMLK